MDELFDVFEDQPQGATSTAPPHSNKSRPEKKSKKRQINGAVKDENGITTNGGASDASDSSDMEVDERPTDGSPTSKRQRLDAEPEPVVTDTFETEQSREVAASAGLQGTKETAAVVLSHQVRHQVSLPPDYPYVPISEHRPPETPAKEFKFTLDPFQQVSVTSIERNESVLVSAHTSAGKTVVAEYAIAQCLKNNQRVIYTSPIKALSNQKYRDFQSEFGDVGLMTGDVTINPTATCLVMTTEILRSMLYRGSEIMREVGWVIFDEIHYLRDAIRGVVWEETIILLPDKVRYVFLSATIPNAMQFAEWITKTHNQPCHVVYTDFRPTPLQHYFFPAGAEGIHLIVDEKGSFREENFQKAMAAIEDKQGDDPADANAKRRGRGKDKRLNKGGQKGPSDIWKIVRMIMMKDLNPVIVFSFSKRECEHLALQMSNMSFNDDSEKQMVSKVFESALESLSEEDRKLPQIEHILPLLRRGIGIHHSGLLPILKETIEILFQENLIKVLFATETFSIGLNMPAKTVVFTNVRKFDGKSTRWLTPSEFVQMSGRAGRRGLDDRGIVIMMINEQMDPAIAKDIVRGLQDKLNSAFHLGYNMLLNLMRVEGISPEFMLERCFHQFQNTASVSHFERELRELEHDRASMQISDEAVIQEYYHLRQELDILTADMRSVMQHPNYSLQFLQPGRLVHIKHADMDFGWGAVLNFTKREAPRGSGEIYTPQQSWSVDVMLACGDGYSPGTKAIDTIPPGIHPPREDEMISMKAVPCLLECVQEISHIRIFVPQDIDSHKGRAQVYKAIEEVKKRFSDGLSCLDPIENMQITDDGFRRLLSKIERLESRLLANPLYNSPRLPQLYNAYAEKQKMSEKIRSLKKEIQNALSIMQLDELKCRKRVLRRFGFIDDNDVVTLKARVACEISTGDELMLAELLFNGFFNDLSPQQIAALLSCFVFEEKVNEPPALKKELENPVREIQKMARMVAKVSVESKLPVNEEEYVQSFKTGIVAVIFEWACGKSFAEIW